MWTHCCCKARQEVILSVSLQRTLELLEGMKTEQNPEGILILQELGNHIYCDLESNCPEAIKLRRTMEEAGVTVEAVLQENERLNQPDPAPRELSLPGFSGKVLVSIAGKNIEVDLSEMLQQELIRATNHSILWYKNQVILLKTLGRDLYQAYLNDIERNRRVKTLPQLSFSLAELLHYQCIVNSLGNHSYCFTFPFLYNPQWLWSRGKRYALAQKDIDSLKQEKYITFVITPDKKFYSIYLNTITGSKFRHYHSDDRKDCWGQVRFPEVWDGKLKSLLDLAYQMQAALTTINLDSLYDHYPPEMYDAKDLLDRATYIGVEGVRSDEHLDAVSNDEASLPRAIPRRWGER
jgi:hypothetical protein